MSTPPGRTPLPTIDEVAELAGVSRATVSRVVNGYAGVRPGPRRAVEEAVAQLRYVPNRLARSLVTRRTDTIALVLVESDTQVFSDPFFARVVRELSASLADTELNLVLLAARGEREQEKVARYVRQGHVDGVVLVSLHRRDLLPGVLAEARVPLVLCGRPFDDAPVCSVDADNTGGGQAATAHLLAAGRRRVATVTGPQDMVAGIDRLAGHRAALAAAGLPADPALEVEGDFTEAGGATATAALLARAPDLDGVFVASDPMAVGALRVLREAGRSVPGDVAVVGFDDAPVAATTDPPLTTVAQPLGEMTRLVVELLLAQVAGGEPERARVCPTRLVVRGSA